MTQCIRVYETFSEDLSDDTYDRYEQEQKPSVYRVQVKKVNGKIMHKIVDKRAG